MTALHAVAAIFASYMLVRHLPAVRALLGRGGRARPPMAIVSVVNVLLALAILAFAVKGLVGDLMSP
jgi:hypothetical protein